MLERIITHLLHFQKVVEGGWIYVRKYLSESVIYNIEHTLHNWLLEHVSHVDKIRYKHNIPNYHNFIISHVYKSIGYRQDGQRY